MENFGLRDAKYLYRKTDGKLVAIVLPGFKYSEEEYEAKEISDADLITFGTLVFRDAARRLDPGYPGE